MIKPHGPTLEVNLAAIASNYQLLCSQHAKKRIAAVVKANAYGLGVDFIAPVLYREGCREFFVATLAEGIDLRAMFTERGIDKPRIFVFHGARKGETDTFITHRLVPVLNCLEQVKNWADAGPYALHIDTGMCRLGLDLLDLPLLPPVTDKLVLVMSHLASSNAPGGMQNKEQLVLFQQALRHFPGVPASLANSSGIFLGPDFHFDLARPGCALYGITPDTATSHPIASVVTLTAPVLQYRTIHRTQTVGYGATATTEKGAVLATIELGYADGLLRSLSNKGFAFAHGMKFPIIGRVSMDMISIDVTALPEALRTHDLRVTIIGKEQPANVLAHIAGTIGYELFTRLGSRMNRVYSHACDKNAPVDKLPLPV